MVIYNTPANLSKILEFFDGLPEMPKCLVDVNMWFEDTRSKMDDELIPIIDFKPSAKMPLYYNLFIIGGFRTTNYENIHLPLDNITWSIEWDATEDTKCCCSHIIQTVYLIKAPYLTIITGCDCIKKRKLLFPEEVKILKKQKRDTKKIMEVKRYIAKKRLVQGLQEKFVEDEKIRVEKEKIIEDEKIRVEKLRVQKEKQFRLKNKLCLDCGKKCDWPKCWQCVKKCACGKTIQPQYEQYDICKACSKEEYSKKVLKS